jgi:hypothetical protein
VNALKQADRALLAVIAQRSAPIHQSKLGETLLTNLDRTEDDFLKSLEPVVLPEGTLPIVGRAAQAEEAKSALARLIDATISGGGPSNAAEIAQQLLRVDHINYATTIVEKYAHLRTVALQTPKGPKHDTLHRLLLALKDYVFEPNFYAASASSTSLYDIVHSATASRLDQLLEPLQITAVGRCESSSSSESSDDDDERSVSNDDPSTTGGALVVWPTLPIVTYSSIAALEDAVEREATVRDGLDYKVTPWRGRLARGLIARRDFAVGELVTTFDGRVEESTANAVDDAAEPAHSLHVRPLVPGVANTAYVHGYDVPSDLGFRGGASVVNDASVDPYRSLRQGRIVRFARRRRNRSERRRARFLVNTEFVTLTIVANTTTTSGKQRVIDASATAPVRIALRATRPIRSGDEVAVDFGAAFWRRWIDTMLADDV